MIIDYTIKNHNSDFMVSNGGKSAAVFSAMSWTSSSIDVALVSFSEMNRCK